MKRIGRTGVSSITDSPSAATSLVASSIDILNNRSNGIPSEYPFRINNYSVPPKYEISLEQFEEFAFNRLQLLRAVESASMKHIRDDEIAKNVKSFEDKWMPLHSNESALSFPLLEERKRDHASHYILRIAFAANADSTRWFISQETLLFKIRFINEMAKERVEFLNYASAKLKALPKDQKATLIDKLAASSPGKENEEFFLIDFEKVPDLVGKRAVYLEKGTAYVPRCDLFSAIVTKFRENLEYWMEQTRKELPSIRDERLIPLLNLVKGAEVPRNMRLSNDSSAKGLAEGKLTVEDLDNASLHFPPCMQQLFLKAKQDHHLKYNGRQQLGLFLKSIGLSLEDAIVFWRKVFVPKCGEDGFQKNYVYNIRHNYGQEGKRANYGPDSCGRIMTGASPGGSELHGCPFKHSSGDSLAARLATYSGPQGHKLEAPQIEELVELSRGSHCQQACTRLFQYTRPQAPSIDTITFPSNFYAASIRLTKPPSK